MIVKMLKAYVVVGLGDKDRLLQALRGLGAVHLQAVDPGAAGPDERTVSAIQRLARAEQVLDAIEPAGQAPDLEPLAAADRTLDLVARAGEMNNRLNALTREAGQLEPWGDMRLADLRALREAGVELRFYDLPADDVASVRAESVEVVATRPRGRRVVAVASRAGAEPAVPESAQPVPLPERDRPTVLAEAREIDQALRLDREELTRLAHRRGAMAERRRELEIEAQYVVADRSGLRGGDLFAVQGWVPAHRQETLEADLRAAGVVAAVEAVEPGPEEQPPTLIRYPKWALPIQGLFQMLGVVPGYREFDVGGAFMIALPLFSAMLIADAAYGLLFLLAGVLLYGKCCKALGPRMTQLLIVTGAVATAWGVLIGSYFSIEPAYMMANSAAGSFLHRLGGFLAALQVLPGGDDPNQFAVLAWLTFILGAIHMSAAHVWQAIGFFPNLRALAQLGWAIFLWGMLFVVRYFVLSVAVPAFAPWLLAVGGALAVLFAAPDRNPVKMVAMGLANFPLSAIGTLGDTISYIRLMAIGLAGSALGMQFNMLIGQLAQSASWVVGVPLLAVAHALNIALAIIALFAHGVRLNMLEFSSHLGMTWSGYPYEPFSNKQA